MAYGDAAVEEMKLLLLLSILSLALAAQRISVNVIAWSSEPTLSAVVCRVFNDDRVEIAPGRERECWELVVAAHNDSMDDPERHAMQDRILVLVGSRLGRKVIRCAR